MRAPARLLLAVAASTVCLAAESPEPAPPPAPRPKLALVLSGGGARGAAHIGALRVLEEARVVPDIIVGTSMGSIVGGLYAAGWTPDEIEEFLKETDFNKVFSDRPERSDKSVRRKQDDLLLLVNAKMRLKGFKPYLPPGLLGGQRLELLLKKIEFESTDEQDFDRLPVPYRAVAADIGTGEAVVLSKGSLATAMRASMSISGAFAPVEIDGRKLVDGGAVANLPVAIAQRLGAERIIAVDISSPLAAGEELGSFLSIINQMTGLLTTGNVQEDIRRLDLAAGDVFIRPELGDISFSSFNRATEAVAIGEAEARKHLDELRRYASPPERWTELERRRKERPPSSAIVEEVRFKNQSWVADEVVRRRLEISPGESLEKIDLEQAVIRLAALDYFGLIRPTFVRSAPNRGALELDLPKKPYGRNLIQFGLQLESDWEEGRRSNNAYELIVRHQALALNRHGGEWQNVIQVGSEQSLASQFYQPLDYGMRWFVRPSIFGRLPTEVLWLDEAPVATYELTHYGGAVDLGRVFERWGELSVTAFREVTDGDVGIGVPILPKFRQDDGGAGVRFTIDTLDTVVFPTRGTEVLAQWLASLENFGADTPNTNTLVRISHSLTWKKYTFTVSAEGLTNTGDDPAFYRNYRLGGAFRLSGLGEEELLGEKGGLTRILCYREIAKLNVGPIRSRVFGGLSLEAGNVYGEDDPITADSLRTGGSLFLGAETPIGPAFLGFGYTESGRKRLYLSVGRRF